MLTDRRTALLLLACAALAGHLTACSPGGDERPATQPTPSAVVPAPPPAQPSPEEQAAEAVSQAVEEYYRLTDTLFSDPQVPIERVTDVAGGAELDEVRTLVQQERAAGRRQVGVVTVASLEITDVSLAVPTTASAQVCLDVSGVDVVNADGTSVVVEDRPPQTLVGLDLAEQEITGWVVRETTSEGLPCDAP